ncbi:MAG: class I SAM-dependent methyltransferase [Bacteroidales bacterium]|nr:class I SAM-dependent methyltransferase [Bacteroidales bacterium]
MTPLSPEWWQWLDEHLHLDPTALSLRYHGLPGAQEAIQQIALRQKARKKLPSLVANPRTLLPTALSVEQATSEALALLHAQLIEPGARVLDLTCGLGADAMAMATRAREVVAYERQEAIASAVAHNAGVLGLTNLHVVCGDALEALKEMGPNSRDVIFVDPARRGGAGERLFALSQCEPDVVALMPRLLEIAPKVIVKASPMLDVTQTLRELPQATHIIIYGTTRECKEVVAVVERRPAEEVTISCVTSLTASTASTFSFTLAKEREAVPQYRLPVAGDVVYEPWPAVMKGGPFRLLATGVFWGLHPHTHLYLSAEEQAFPGRPYRVESVEPFDRATIKSFARRYPQINVATRQFVMRAPELARRLKVKEGGELQLFGVTNLDGEHILLVCRPLEAAGSAGVKKD